MFPDDHPVVAGDVLGRTTRSRTEDAVNITRPSFGFNQSFPLSLVPQT